jgi:hypothetical protein
MLSDIELPLSGGSISARKRDPDFLLVSRDYSPAFPRVTPFDEYLGFLQLVFNTCFESVV